MTDDDPQPPGPRLGQDARSEAARRRARQAAALRENLRRRKARDRACDDPAAPRDESSEEG